MFLNGQKHLLAVQQARLGGIGLALMVCRMGSEAVANSGPGFGIDQRRMLAEVERTLVGNLGGTMTTASG
jgi:hypothetical protein